jgi:hypothetical protein
VLSCVLAPTVSCCHHAFLRLCQPCVRLVIGTGSRRLCRPYFRLAIGTGSRRLGHPSFTAVFVSLYREACLARSACVCRKFAKHPQAICFIASDFSKLVLSCVLAPTVSCCYLVGLLEVGVIRRSCSHSILLSSCVLAPMSALFSPCDWLHHHI